MIEQNHFSCIYNQEEQLSPEQIARGLEALDNYKKGVYDPKLHPLLEEHDKAWSDILAQPVDSAVYNTLVFVREELGKLGSELLEYVLNPYEIRDRIQGRRFVRQPDGSLPRVA